MKFLMILLSVTFTTAAMACPNLAGEYQCYDDEEGYYTEEISQSGSGTKTTYTTTDEEGVNSITADNKWRSVGAQVKMKAFCKSKALNVSIQQVIPGQGTVKANVNVVLNASLDMIQTTSVSFEGQQMPTRVNTCTRL